MVPDIDIYIGRVLDSEKGYVNDPADSGGETNFGITVAVARAFGYFGPMKDMTREQATTIYRTRYWTQPKFDQINAIDRGLAFILFDTGVNMGQSTGVAYLQRCLNVLNLEGSLFPDIAADGGIGAMTIAALNAFVKARGTAGLRILRDMVKHLRGASYITQAENKASQERYEYGWQTRLSDLEPA
ncbi:glycoside hydrolase family 108 protein [Paraburkholderia terrae]|uniref:glycoside hydrolase family 108 protein n=1 Tax=Paraburkholderia terrae TaxID=311230 RepID=UPI001EE1D4EA|nr:glycosyl hydrolase 108 family protein [Paraburkholderia terrae]GJH00201.1 N-acetylmuramidase [Paraburkholderia terrae]